MKNKTIKMHNALAMAKYRMTLSEQKLFIYAIKHLDQEKSHFLSSSFLLTDFARDAELNLTHLYNEIDDMSSSVMQTLIFIKDGDNPKNWEKYNLTSNCKFKDGRVIFEFNDKMVTYLLQLQKHYFLQAPMVITFGSWYSMRLYDMFKAHSYKKEPFEILLSDLKEILDLKGKYERFNNFRDRIIDVAIDEINKKSDISVSFDRKTKGRKVVGLIFEIDSNKVSGLESLNNIIEIREKARLEDSDFSDYQVLKLYEATVYRFTNYRNAEDIYNYMAINYNYTKKIKKEGNVYGYYKNCLENDHAKAISQVLNGYIIDDVI